MLFARSGFAVAIFVGQNTTNVWFLIILMKFLAGIAGVRTIAALYQRQTEARPDCAFDSRRRVSGSLVSLDAGSERLAWNLDVFRCVSGGAILRVSGCSCCCEGE